jgi:2-oxoglutarate ferredoxin oxidoreductase subunit alpha
MDVYRRYAFSEDGVSPYTAPGTPGGMSLVTGNEHDEDGHVSTDPDNRRRMMDKRLGKVERARALLPSGRRHGDGDAAVGFLGIGMTYGVILEAMERLAASGLPTQFLSPRTLWPMLEETLDFVAGCRRVYVVEHNATAQLAHLLAHQGAEAAKLRSVLKYDGTPLRPGEVVSHVLAREQEAVQT